MIPQTIILSVNAGWQNAQLFCTQGESARPFRFKVENGSGFLNLSAYTQIVLAIDLGGSLSMPVCSAVSDYEVEVKIPAEATAVSGTFPCWLALIGDGVELRIGGIGLQCNPCGIDQILGGSSETQGLLEQLIAKGEYAQTQGDYAKAQGQAAETIVERWKDIPVGDFDAMFPVSVANGGTGATTATQARSNLGAADANHGHALTDTGITGILPLTKGGTGASTASQARTNLGAASSSHTHSLSSTSIIGILPVSKGGTGASSAQAARTSLQAVGTDDIIDVAHGGTGASTPETARTNLGFRKLLWSGTWKTGQITVPNFSNYTSFELEVSGSNTIINASIKSNALRGNGSYLTSADYVHLFVFSANISGNTLTYVGCVDAALGSNGNLDFTSTDNTITAIYGVY